MYSALFGRDWRLLSKSTANIVIRVRRWSKLAALGALSAFIVLKRRRRRWGPGVEEMDFEDSCRAVKAKVWWAMLGGLKEESRMMRVWGWFVGDGGVAGWGVRL